MTRRHDDGKQNICRVYFTCPNDDGPFWQWADRPHDGLVSQPEALAFFTDTEPDPVVVVPWARLADADRQFAEWLSGLGPARDELLPDDVFVDTACGKDGLSRRRYRVRQILDLS